MITQRPVNEHITTLLNKIASRTDADKEKICPKCGRTFLYVHHYSPEIVKILSKWKIVSVIFHELKIGEDMKMCHDDVCYLTEEEFDLIK